MNTIKVGGADREYKLLLLDLYRFEAKLQVVKSLIASYAKRGKVYNLDMFICWCVWQSLVKRGIWPFKKPFRSLAHMIKNVEAEEYQGLCDFVSKATLPQKPVDEKKNQGGS